MALKTYNMNVKQVEKNRYRYIPMVFIDSVSCVQNNITSIMNDLANRHTVDELFSLTHTYTHTHTHTHTHTLAYP